MKKKIDNHCIKITMIAPKKNKSRQRFIVEQTFSHLKMSYMRLNIIYDRNIEMYVVKK